MKVINYNTPYTQSDSLPLYYQTHYPDSKLLFFDIETTGFTAKNTTLYLIGVLWYENNNIHIRQWFNDDIHSESDMLTAFMDFCENYTHLVHFNGIGFDLPYLKQKATLLDIPFHLDARLQQIDIYKEIRNYKNVFALDNMKQTSIETFLGIDRDDKYTGKELIHIYQKYITKQNQDMEKLLLLHNHDDLLGMPQISRILDYKIFFDGINIDTIELVETKNTLDILFSFYPITLPRRISITKNNCYLNAIEQKASLQIPITKGILKHFFSDYKNYYYLPNEDMAIHASIAQYVDKQNKQKATKNTCYIKKEDVYIPCINTDNPEQFKADYQDKNIYQTLSSFTNSPIEIQKEYIQKILRSLI